MTRRRPSAVDGGLSAIARRQGSAFPTHTGTKQAVRRFFVAQHRFPDFRAIYNVALYVLLFDRDFSVLKVQMLQAEDQWSRKCVARQMAVALAALCEPAGDAS